MYEDMVTMKWKLITALVIIFAAGLAFGAYRVGQQKKSEVSTSTTDVYPSGMTPENVSAVTGSDYVIGDTETAELILVEYADLNCSFCAQFHLTMLELMEEYGDRIAWVYRHYPVLGSQMESEAAECVGEQGGNQSFWDYIDLYYSQEPAEIADKQALMVDLAKSLNLDIAECLANGDAKQLVDADNENALSIGIQGTPTTVLIVPATQEYEVLAGMYSTQDMFDILGSYLD